LLHFYFFYHYSCCHSLQSFWEYYLSSHFWCWKHKIIFIGFHLISNKTFLRNYNSSLNQPILLKLTLLSFYLYLGLVLFCWSHDNDHLSQSRLSLWVLLTLNWSVLIFYSSIFLYCQEDPENIYFFWFYDWQTDNLIFSFLFNCSYPHSQHFIILSFLWYYIEILQ